MKRPPRNRRVRIALRKPSAWRQWRVRVEAVLAQRLDTGTMERVWRDLAVYGSASYRVAVDEMVKVTSTPHRKWFRLTRPPIADPRA